MQSIESFQNQILSEGIDKALDAVIKYIETYALFDTKTPKADIKKIEINDTTLFAIALKRNHERFKNLLKLCKIVEFDTGLSEESIVEYSKAFNVLKKHLQPKIQAIYKKIIQDTGSAEFLTEYFGNYFKLHQIKQQ